MKWFTETFLPSFETGKELRISEKQFDIFCRYARNYEEEVSGFVETLTYNVGNKKVVISKHRCRWGATYWVKIN